MGFVLILSLCLSHTIMEGMRYRALGKTGYQPSETGYGTCGDEGPLGAEVPRRLKGHAWKKNFYS